MLPTDVLPWRSREARARRSCLPALLARAQEEGSLRQPRYVSVSRKLLNAFLVPSVVIRQKLLLRLCRSS